VGFSTGGSLVHRIFDRWAAVLDRPWQLRGVDLPADSPPAMYRRLVETMRHNPAVLGAVVTGHKLRLYRACETDLTQRDPAVDLTHEINTLSTGDGGVAAYARDALSLTHVLPGLLRDTAALSSGDAHLVCLGAGGAATALMLALHLEHAPDMPASLVFADKDPHALDALRDVSDRVHAEPGRLSFVPVSGPADCDALVAERPRPTLVVNATGLGKDVPGSPVTGRAAFGPTTLAWDLNYRGDLTYLDQASARGAVVVDGWDYFVAGWAGGLTAIAGIPLTADLLDRFHRAARTYAPTPRT
jgi:shikimate 5-dehydrogenase